MQAVAPAGGLGLHEGRGRLGQDAGAGLGGRPRVAGDESSPGGQEARPRLEEPKSGMATHA